MTALLGGGSNWLERWPSVFFLQVTEACPRRGIGKRRYDSDASTDAAGCQVGDPGFVRPVLGRGLVRSFPVGGAYDAQYRDACGRKPGDAGFVPPLRGVTPELVAPSLGLR